MTWLLLLALHAVLLHPGHATRVELGLSADGERLEVAWRIDSGDLEAAMRNTEQRTIDVEQLAPAELQRWMIQYLQETWRVNEARPDTQSLRWVGAQRKLNHHWLFFELDLPKPDKATKKQNAVKLQIRSLFEIEPEVQHAVTLDDTLGNRAVIIGKPDAVIELDIEVGPAAASARQVR